MTAHAGYRPDIDGLRAVAVVLVILFHAGFDWVGGGFVGVDVFFVISGFLITTIILRERRAGTFSLGKFYERRCRRILPALFFVVACTVLPALMWMTPKEVVEFGDSLVAVSLFASNVLFWQTSGYFDLAAEAKPLLHTWSLGVEEQFYVVFPLVVGLLWAFRTRTQVASLVAIALGSLGIAVFAGQHAPAAAFYLAPTRAWELIVGALLAYGTLSGSYVKWVDTRWAGGLSVLGFAMILTAALAFGPSTNITGVAGLLPTIGTALVLGYLRPGTALAGFLSSRLMVGGGLVSYSAYLWHQPLFAFARIRSLDEPSPPVLGALGIAAFALAYLTWRFVETPFRDPRRVPRRPLVAVCAAASVAVVALGASLRLSEGFPSRSDVVTQAMLQTTVFSPQRLQCHTEGSAFLAPEDACVYQHTRATWAALGDSHVVEPAYALAERLNPQGEGVIHLSFSACGPSLEPGLGPIGCNVWQNRAVARLEGDSIVRDVLVGFRLHYYLERARNSGGGVEATEDIWRNFDLILGRLQAAGKRTFLLLPVPELEADVNRLIFNFGRSRRGDSDVVEGVALDSYRKQADAIRTRLGALGRKFGSTPVDPASVLCDAARCYAALGGEAMYFDDNHLSVAGSRRVISTMRWQ